MKNIKTMKVFGSALLIFGCFIIVLVLGVDFTSEDKNKVESNTAQHRVYESIGELGGFSKGEGVTANIINEVNDNIDNPDLDVIINCYTNSSVTAFRDYLRAVNFSKGQFCKVQQNLEVTSTTNQINNERCIAPASIILSADELEKLDRQYTGDLTADLASCKI
ncbi:hypothetical protein [Psychromonas marina]|uniref:hypothetical protein n=1 Tax=Psychromonas marina TaxID=88364 RepID=UPI0024E13A0E|nr:hypothetical protein [Psychromonas marina]